MSDVPFELSGFEPLERIGSGGFGEVWLARQINIDRKVAVKVGHAPIDDKTVQLRFERECIALGRLSGHPNIIDVFTAGQLDDGRPYLVLEYVGGGTLWQRLQRGSLTEAEIHKIATELADALEVAHRSGVLHRDLKPENVLLRTNGEAVLGDFGIARLHDGAHTTSHAITASVAYAAPEILSGKSASPESDLYGIGICLLAAVLRSVPFVQKTDGSIHPIINRVLTDRPPDLRRHGLTPELAGIIQSLLEKEPSHRPASAAMLKQQLQHAAESARAGRSTPAQLPSQESTSPAPAGSPQTIQSTPPPGPGFATGPTPYRGPPSSGPATTGFPQQPVAPQAESYANAGSRPEPFRPSNKAGGAGRGSGRGRTGEGDDGSGRLGLFAAAFGATLLVGGLAVFAATRLGGGETTTTTEESATNSSNPDTTETDTDNETSSTTEDVPEELPEPTSRPGIGPLVLPLRLDDIDLQSDAIIEADTAGPAASQFCNKTPDTDGLEDWLGETYKDPASLPIVFHELQRFESGTDAIDFVSEYLQTVDCSEWVVPGEDGNPDSTIQPVIVSPAATYGDETREIRFQGEANITFFGRVSVVRRDTDVYIISKTALRRDDLDEIDGLLEVAVERLGY